MPYSAAALITNATNRTPSAGVLPAFINEASASILDLNTRLGVLETGEAAEVTLGTAQTITGAKTFTQPVTMPEITGNLAYDGITANAAFRFKTFHPSLIPLSIHGMTGQNYPLTEWRNGAGAELVAIRHDGRLMLNGYDVTAAIGVLAPGAGTVGIVVRGAVSQTADLQQWKNNAGTTLAKVMGKGTFHTGPTGSDAQLNVTPAAATDVGVIVRGFASQTAALQEWQNSAGTAVASVTNAGTVNATQFGNFGSPLLMNAPTQVNGGGTGQNVLTVIGVASATAAVALVRGGASQSGDLQQWQNSTGSVLASIQADGSIHALNSVSSKFWAAAAGSIPLSVRGAPSQTGDLQQWQNSAGAVLAKVGADGTTSLPSVANPASFANSFLVMAATGASITTAVAANRALVVRNDNAAATADLQQWQDSAGAALVRVQAGGLITTSAYVADPNLNSYVLRTNTSINNRFRAAAASHIPLVLQGAASQTGDLQQWQDTAGVVLSAVTSKGTLKLKRNQWHVDDADAERFHFAIDGATFLKGAGAGAAGLIVRGLAAQTGDLQQWQDSAGTTLSRLSADGGISVRGHLLVGSPSPAGAVHATPPDAATRALVVRGAASQTADLQQWQNSAGTALVAINSGGDLVFGANDPQIRTSSGTLRLINPRSESASAASTVAIIRGAASQTADLQQWQNSAGTVIGSVYADGMQAVGVPFTVSSFAPMLAVNNQNASRIGLAVRAIASQTADLQQWQDSAGAVLAKITSNGEIHSVQAYYEGIGVTTSYALHPTINPGTRLQATDPGRTPLFVKAAASQTADLQRWQDSAGTTLSKVGPNGEFESVVAGGAGQGGIVLKSPGGTRYRVTVTDAGTLFVAAA